MVRAEDQTGQATEKTAERLWTVRDVADFLQVSTKCVYRLVANDGLPHTRLSAHILRFHPARVREYAVNRGTEKGKVVPLRKCR